MDVSHQSLPTTLDKTKNITDNLRISEILGSMNRTQIFIRGRRQNEKNVLQKTLQRLDREIAEEEAILKLERDKLQVKEVSLVQLDEQFKSSCRISECQIKKTKKARKETKSKAKEDEHILSLYKKVFVVPFRLDCESIPGKILCPEGKMCASPNEREQECKFWDCPGISGSSTK